MEPWQTAVEAARSKKAEDIVVLDIGKVSSFTEFFVICTGTNVRQTQAIADAIQEKLRAEGWRPMGIEGEQRGEWILVDYGDMLVHVFTPERRAYYDLERLWSKAPRVSVPEEAPVEG